jgi:integrase
VWRSEKGSTQKTVRIKRHELAPDAPEESARAIAAECERLARILAFEAAPPLPAIERARELGVITAAQARAFAGGIPIEAPAPKEPTILEAARAHPSTGRERDKDLRQAIRHENLVKEFTAFTGVALLRDLTLESVMRWIAEMRRREWGWDMRRHALLWIRRAGKLAPQWGLGDPLAGMVLDCAPASRPRIAVHGLDALVSATYAFQEAGTPRPMAILVLGGFLGLRPSEIYRAQVGDVQGGILSIGLRERKTHSSFRALPLPGVVAEWLAPFLEGRAPEEPILTHAKGGAYFEDTLGHAWRRMRAPLDGPVAQLRKSFITWAYRSAKVSIDDIDTWTGHAPARASAVTIRHYLSDATADQLRPAAAALDAAIRHTVSLHLAQVQKNQ